MHRRGGWVLGSFFLLLAGLAIFAPAELEREVALGVLAAALFVIPLHELGHALAGWLVGYRITFLRYGWGETFARLRLFDTDIEVLNTPFGGAVNGYPRRRRRFPRLRHWALVAGGLSAQLALDRTLVAILGASLWSFHDHPMAAATAWANRILFAMNAYPFPASTGALTDGYQLVALPFRSAAYVEAAWVAAVNLQVKAALLRGEVGRVLAIGRTARDLLTRKVGADVWIGLALHWMRRHEEAAAAWREGLSQSETPVVAAWFKSRVALTAVLLRREADLSEAEQLSREALEAAPDDRVGLRARAAVLLKLGRTTETWPFVERDEITAVDVAQHRAYAHAIAAVARAARGEVEPARRALDAARAADGACELLGWAEASLAAAVDRAAAS